MRSHGPVVLVGFSTALSVSPNNPMGECATGFTLCSPIGANSGTTPTIGSPSFPDLFADILYTLPKTKRLVGNSHASLCCTTSLSCLVMVNLEIPFCYDEFTTNYFLPDGSYGTIVGGAYKSSSGDIANLETGEYTLADGQRGNIYAANEAAKPDTSTLPMPTQFTASGVGSAIPGSALGAEITWTYTTTLPGSTIEPITIPPSTIADVVTSISMILRSPATETISGSVVTTTIIVNSISPSTISGTVNPGTTITGSTIVPKVTTITITEAGPPTSATSSSSTTMTKSSASRGLCCLSMRTLFALALVLLRVL